MTRTGSLVVVVLLLLGAVAQAGPRFLGPPVVKVREGHVTYETR